MSNKSNRKPKAHAPVIEFIEAATTIGTDTAEVILDTMIEHNTNPDAPAPATTISPETKVAPTLTADQLDEYNKQTTVSGKIRYLSGLGWERSAIAKHTNKIYQHVRNVLETPLKRKA